MFEVEGKYNKAKIFTDHVSEKAVAQVIELCNQEFVKDSQIRMMPDIHPVAGCTIGTTMTIQDKIVPNLVGVDISCGLEVAIIDQHKDEINYEQLDDVIRKYVPYGYNVQPSSRRHPFSKRVNFRDIRAPFSLKRAKDSIGTLGGGNHFIELNEYDNKVALVVHSGSRALGKQVAEYYQKRAYDELVHEKSEQDIIIARLKAEGREREIHEALRNIKKPKVFKDLAYLQGNGFDDYIHDMKIIYQYALLNRKAMIDIIATHMNWTIVDGFTTVHNYIDTDSMILRKGAISANKDERVIIPINMRDGSIIATGKGNPDWNYSAPHGAGRVLSRSKAREELNLDQFKDQMKDVWTSSVGETTIDEAPLAYKSIDQILEYTGDAITVDKIIKPLYNFKAN